jgi:teichoic acid transport system permease protein
MSLSDYARQHGLKRVGARPEFLEYLAQAWSRRDFAFTLSLFANQAANARNRLGRWWVLLLPTIQALVYGLIFGIIMGCFPTSRARFSREPARLPATWV